MRDHRAAFEYDWRARFHLPLSSVGHSIGWGEALRLFEMLSADPSSAVAAALAGWAHPFSWEALILADLFDVQVASKSKKKQKPWYRPWRRKDQAQTRMGRAVSIAEFEELRRRAYAAGSREVNIGR